MDSARKALEALEAAGKAATERPWGHGDGCCGPFLDFQEASPEWDVNWNGRSALWLGGTVDEKDRAFIVAAVNLSAPLAAVVRAVADRWWWIWQWSQDAMSDVRVCMGCHERSHSGRPAGECPFIAADAALDALEAAAKAQGFQP